MSFICDIDPIPVVVKESLLYNDPKKQGYEKAYWIACTTLASRPLFATVHLESGALFSLVPINELFCTKYSQSYYDNDYSPEDLQPYSCLDGNSQYITYKYLKDYDVICKIGETQEAGHYLFTLATEGPGLASDPEQSKTLNIVSLSNGSVAALPNNYLLFTDGYFTDNISATFPPYRRNSHYPTGPS